MSDAVADQVLQQIEQLPKPTLRHGKSGMRSGAMTLMYVATRQSMNADEAIALKSTLVMVRVPLVGNQLAIADRVPLVTSGFLVKPLRSGRKKNLSSGF